MAPNNEASSSKPVGDYGERYALEGSILRALCLTINAAGSEIKYKILDTLSEDDFYFPVHKSILTVLTDMHRKGDYVVYTNLEEELRHQAVHIPEDLFLEDFFQGELPELKELGRWLARLKDRSRVPLTPAPWPVAKSPSLAVEKSVPSLKPPGSPAVDSARSDPEVARPKSAELKESVGSLSITSARLLKSEAGMEKRPARQKSVMLSSEGDEWESYLEELASKQGRILETGFAAIDEPSGGLSLGLMLLADEDVDRRVSLLKQLIDQVAARSKVPCLYVSFEVSKAALRIRTLSRLSGVPAKDIEKGRFRKDSPEWEKVETTGRKAATWLKRVFMVEAASDTEVASIEDMARQLGKAGEGKTCMIVVDNLDKWAEHRGDARGLVAKLKELSESLEVLLVVGTKQRALLSKSDTDYTANVGEGKGQDQDIQLEILAAGHPQGITVRLDFRPAIHRFTEKSAL